jgi:hypothetical protein
MLGSKQCFRYGLKYKMKQVARNGSEPQARKPRLIRGNLGPSLLKRFNRSVPGAEKCAPNLWVGAPRVHTHCRRH